MGIFQKSVIKSHLETLDVGQVEKSFQKFNENYNSAKIEEIKSLKEEEYQSEFLREIFVDVLGYILRPSENFNLALEFKNQGDSKKADGAILKDGKAVAVIELKSTKTKDLKIATEQAFGYKHNQPDCKYVIISNFQKVQFYIDYANEYEEFDLFNLQRDEFELLYLLLNAESILNDLPLKLKNETKFHEENISNKLYKDYSIFRNRLFENLVKNNPNEDKLTLFKKSQKLLDRFLFILFAEDRLLLPANSITRIIDNYNKLEELDAYKPIYDIFKQYFGYMNNGRKGKTYADNIPAYNGGLFYPDELLDKLVIDDGVLINDLLNLSTYDFNTEVDVNILGHIFEHSLSEIEEISAEIAATAAARGHVPLNSMDSLNSLNSMVPPAQKTSKRKKDGIFYTPKYITQYIVENTIGTLCKEKRKEFEISEIEIDDSYYKKKSNSSSSRGRDPLAEKGNSLFNKLNEYKKWLLSLKIVDPACGSGAFLNQALNFLIAEHKSIDDIIAELTNTPLRLFDTEKSILENNLYGVDINEESVEIAKLSLWLRTAHRDRKLSNLNSNIKCGNSLIDDPKVAGDKAFNWNKEFPQVFRKKKKQAWHITTATHNSRYSERMFKYHVNVGEAVYLSENDAIFITQTISDITKESKEKNEEIYLLAYNICSDHLHILLVCEEEEVSKIVGKIKAITAKKYNIEKGITTIATDISTSTRGHVPLSEEGKSSSLVSAEEDNLSSAKKEKKKYNSLWTQKFGNSRVDSEEYLLNAMDYIRNNRVKHELPENFELQNIINGMLTTTEHAFRTEYAGGFDVVIGNPPYVNINTMPEIHEYLKNTYSEIHTGYNDLMYYFLFKGIYVLKDYGIYGVITSNYFIGNDYADKLRLFLNKHIETIVNFEKTLVFDDANVHTTLVFAKKNTQKEIIRFHTYIMNVPLKVIDLCKGYNSCELIRKELAEKWLIANSKNQKIIEKIHLNSKSIGEICDIAKGSESGKNEIFTISIEEANKYNIEKTILRKCVKNSDVLRYYLNENDSYLIYSDNNFSENSFPNTYKYLEMYKDALSDRRGPKTNEYEWWRLHRPSIKEIFDAKEKLLVPYRANKNRFAYDNQQFFNNGGDVRCITLKANVDFSLKYIIALLNSKLLDWFYGFIGKSKGDAREYFNKPLSSIPIKNISPSDQEDFIKLADSMLKLTIEIIKKKK